MSGEFPPVLYLDIIESEPIPLERYVAVNRPGVTDVVIDWDARYRQYLDRFQPFRLVLKSEGNNETLMWSESYFNRADAERTARLIGSASTTVFLRQAEKGNELLRQAVTQ